MQTFKELDVNERKFVAADLEKCTGCRVCEFVCALKREKVYNPKLSRIKVLQLDQILNMPVACRLCQNPPCVTACQLDCLTQSENGVIMVDEEKCDGCGWCIKACPYGAIVFNPDKETVMVCDLCNGEPQCVEWCPEEILDLVTQREFDQKVRDATTSKIITDTLKVPESNGDILEQPENKQTRNQTTLKELEKIKKVERESLNLLLEALSEQNPIDILIYGMYVKKHLSFIVPATSRDKIGKTLQWLSDAIKLVEKSGRR
jgi:Fe-S-cluster-containing dehydrogenase component